jgi:type II secretory pathway predicted ATPase ExeA
MNTITPEILAFFKFNKLPFDKEIELQDLLIHTGQEKTYHKLQLLIETKGLGVLTGLPGTGKSSIIRKLINELHPSLYKPIYVCHTSVGLTEFYTHICSNLGLEAPARKAKMFRLLKDTFEQMNHSSRIHPVLIIDEAHLLCNDILQEIRLLTNFKVDSYNGLTVLLCGQEELNAKFRLSILESLASCITINIKMKPLTQEETYAYVEHRINCVRDHKDHLFTSNALKCIHESSNGNLRNINTIAKAALFKAYHSKCLQIEKEHVTGVLLR